MLQPLGIESPRVRFDLPEQDADADMAEHLMRSHRMVPPAVRDAESGRRLALEDLAGRALRRSRPPAAAPTSACRAWPCGACPRSSRWPKRSSPPASGAATLAPPTTVPQLASLCRRAGAVPGLRHRPDAPGRRRRHADDQPARPQPGRVVRRLRPAKHSPAGPLPGRLCRTSGARPTTPPCGRSASTWPTRRAASCSIARRSARLGEQPETRAMLAGGPRPPGTPDRVAVRLVPC